VLEPQRVKTERDLVAYAQHQAHGKGHFFYVSIRPFSARFYSKGTAGLLSLDELNARSTDGDPLFLAVPNHLIKEVKERLAMPLKEECRNPRFVLIEVRPDTQVAALRPPHESTRKHAE